MMTPLLLVTILAQANSVAAAVQEQVTAESLSVTLEKEVVTTRLGIYFDSSLDSTEWQYLGLSRAGAFLFWQETTTTGAELLHINPSSGSLIGKTSMNRLATSRSRPPRERVALLPNDLVVALAGQTLETATLSGEVVASATTPYLAAPFVTTVGDSVVVVGTTLEGLKVMLVADGSLQTIRSSPIPADFATLPYIVSSRSGELWTLARTGYVLQQRHAQDLALLRSFTMDPIATHYLRSGYESTSVVWAHSQASGQLWILVRLELREPPVAAWTESRAQDASDGLLEVVDTETGTVVASYLMPDLDHVAWLEGPLAIWRTSDNRLELVHLTVREKPSTQMKQ
jgi:hypothetical protein